MMRLTTYVNKFVRVAERVAEWLRRLTRKPKVRTAVGSNPMLDSLVAVPYTSPGRPEPCEGNLVAVAGSCGGVMVKHPWPLLEIRRSDLRGLATLNINTYLPTCPSPKSPHCHTLCYHKFSIEYQGTTIGNSILRGQLKASDGTRKFLT